MNAKCYTDADAVQIGMKIYYIDCRADELERLVASQCVWLVACVVRKLLFDFRRNIMGESVCVKIRFNVEIHTVITFGKLPHNMLQLLSQT